MFLDTLTTMELISSWAWHRQAAVFLDIVATGVAAGGTLFRSFSLLRVVSLWAPTGSAVSFSGFQTAAAGNCCLLPAHFHGVTGLSLIHI